MNRNVELKRQQVNADSDYAMVLLETYQKVVGNLCHWHQLYKKGQLSLQMLLTAAAGTTRDRIADPNLKPGTARWKKAEAMRFCVIARRNAEQMIVALDSIARRVEDAKPVSLLLGAEKPLHFVMTD